MKVLFVSHTHNQTIITVNLGYGIDGFETHLYNQGGHTERWSVGSTFENAIDMHKQLCEKCNIKVNM